MAKLNLDILDLDYDVNSNEAHKIMGDNIALSGNIDPVIIQNASKEEIAIITSYLIESQKGTKIIFSGRLRNNGKYSS